MFPSLFFYGTSRTLLLLLRRRRRRRSRDLCMEIELALYGAGRCFMLPSGHCSKSFQNPTSVHPLEETNCSSNDRHNRNSLNLFLLPIHTKFLHSILPNLLDSIAKRSLKIVAAMWSTLRSKPSASRE